MVWWPISEERREGKKGLKVYQDKVRGGRHMWSYPRHLLFLNKIGCLQKKNSVKFCQKKRIPVLEKNKLVKKVTNIFLISRLGVFGKVLLNFPFLTQISKKVIKSAILPHIMPMYE